MAERGWGELEKEEAYSEVVEFGASDNEVFGRGE